MYIHKVYLRNFQGLSMYVRKCQECGHLQTAKSPASYKGDSWKDTKCRKCQSSALDYGSDSYVMTDGKITRMSSSDDIDDDWNFG